MNLLQSFRRLSQKLSTGWHESFDSQIHQQKIVKKLYAKHGLELILTCSACPEQYEVYKDGAECGYLRLRHGEFRVDFPSCLDETILECYPNGDSMFDDDERLIYMNKALKAILMKLSTTETKPEN